MSEQPIDPAALHGRGEEMSHLRRLAKGLGVAKVRDGSWFRRAVAAHVKKHAADPRGREIADSGAHVDVEASAHSLIVAAARKAAAAGALASVGASSGEILSLLTDGLGAPVGVPAAILSMVIEASYSAVVQIDLACDLATLYGVPFDADDVGEVATLFGLAFGVDLKKEANHSAAAEAQPEGLMAKLMDLEDGELATRIGRKLLEDAVVRNLVPILGVAISARWNYVATTRLGAAVKKYVRYRRALVHSCVKLRLESVGSPEVLIEGAWLLATVDGEAGHEEVMALALLMDQLAPAQRKAIEIDEALGDDEQAWFDGLAALPPETHAALLDTLYMIASADKAIEASERRFLRRVGKALGRSIDFDRIGKICRYLANGEDLPDDFLPLMRRVDPAAGSVSTGSAGLV